MKKVLSLFVIFVAFQVSTNAADIFTVSDLSQMGITANSSIEKSELNKAKQIIKDVQTKTEKEIKKGKGPFYAIIYDDKGNVIAQSANSVVQEKCCLYHAEINTIQLAHKKFKQYDLAPYNLSIYINAEPCIMCSGAIMWSGIKRVFYSVPSKDVEKITGFDEGYKPDWINEFKKRNITVYGNIESEMGKQIMRDYMSQGKEVYKPTR